jgi:hypothetical protein
MDAIPEQDGAERPVRLLSYPPQRSASGWWPSAGQVSAFEAVRMASVQQNRRCLPFLVCQGRPAARSTVLIGHATPLRTPRGVPFAQGVFI